MPGDSSLPNQDLHVGQLNFPKKEELKESFRGIFERQFFTNHGPLVAQLDEQLAQRFGVKNAISVTNGTVALMAGLAALGLKGEVIVPSFTFVATVQSLIWSGLTPVFCDVDTDTHCITPDLVEPLITDKTTAILGVHIWGRVCDTAGLQALATKHNLRLIFDAAHAVASKSNNVTVGGFGVLECFSFHATKVLCGAEGGCLTTNDDELAGLIRTARNFHVSETFANVVPRINGKMTEAQAAITLLSLQDLDENITRNRETYKFYQAELLDIKGIKFVDYDRGQESNCQYVVIEMQQDEQKNREQLLNFLRERNIFARTYFSPGIHTLPFVAELIDEVPKLPNTEHLCRSLIQLPIGLQVSLAEAETVSRLIQTFMKS
ncbi:MAG: aminotransferase class I/II-fold pyridoxal phosphate-dependent enzyme [Planctomycetaceae bacterium]|nr:aminotransferase class I/II-fold pyridoxal phosphate-dependent enzyme [Planctomycetaceae bacterium]